MIIFIKQIINPSFVYCMLGRHGRGRMVVGFTTTYAISAYHHWCCEFESWSGRGVQNYVITFVSDLRQVGGFLRVFRCPTPIKVIATIYLKVVLNTIKQASKHHYFRHFTTQRIQRPIKMAVLNFPQKDSTLWYICLALYREKTVCVNIYTDSWNKYNEQKYYQNAGVVDEKHIYQICIRWYINTY
jgi:hypothetical protein